MAGAWILTYYGARQWALMTRAAERVAAIPDIAMPAVRRLVERRVKGRELSDGELYGRLINGERGGYLGYAMRRHR